MRKNRKAPDPFVQSLAASSRGERRAALVCGMSGLMGRFGAGIALAHLAAALVAGSGLPVSTLAVLGLSVLVMVAATNLEALLTVRAETKVAGEATGVLRAFIARSAVRDVQSVPAGDLASRLTRQPAQIAELLVSGAATRFLVGFGALTALSLIALFSWSAALLLAFAMPVMIVFFVFIGKLTKAHAEGQEEAMQALSGRFGDLVRTLPTILASHREDRAAEGLSGALREHRRQASALLNVAFLNSAVLDFFSSLSVAILAVFLGLGHLGLAKLPGFYGLEFSASLSVLVLAPEVFGQLKRFAEQYHQTAEGREALEAMRPLARKERLLDPRLPAERFAVRGVQLAHVGAVPDITFPGRGLIVLWGASGSGKTTLLRALAGVDGPRSGQVFRGEGRAAWCSADSWIPEGPLGSWLSRSGSLDPVGLAADPRFTDGLATWVAPGGSDLSGGQRLRLSLAAALDGGAGILFADEPTAKTDEATALHVRRALKKASADRLVVLASHDPAMRDLADKVIDLEQRQEVPA